MIGHKQMIPNTQAQRRLLLLLQLELPEIYVEAECLLKETGLVGNALPFGIPLDEAAMLSDVEYLMLLSKERHLRVECGLVWCSSRKQFYNNTTIAYEELDNLNNY